MEVGRVKTVLTGFAGAPGYCTFHFTKLGVLGWDFWAQKSVAQTQAAWTSIISLLPTTMTFATQGLVDVLDSDTGQITSSWQGTTLTGTGTSAAGYGPLATGLSVRYRTNGIVNGKHVNGRTFIVPVAGDLVEANGSPSAAKLAIAVGFGTALLTAAEPNLKLSVFSRPVHATLSNPYSRLGSVHVVTTSTIKDEFAVMRSRRDL